MTISSSPRPDAPVRLVVELEIPPAALARFRRIWGEPTAESFANFLDHTELLGTQTQSRPRQMDLNLALAVVAAETADSDETPYFWPMAELVSFLITECDPADDDEPVLAAIQAQPDLARERAAEIDREVAASKARAQAHEASWVARHKTI